MNRKVQDMERYRNKTTGAFEAPPGFLFKMGKPIKKNGKYEFEVELVKIK